MNSQYLSSSVAVPRRQQKGNALLYTLLALVLGGIGLAVGVNQYQEAERSTSVQASVGEVTAIIGAAKQNFGQYSYRDLTTVAAVGSQIIPANLVDAAGAATNKFGGAITLVDNVATLPNTALLTYAGMPANVCTNIVNGTQALARQVNVAGVPVKPLDGVVNIVTLAAQCTSAGAAGLVPITWTIGRT